MAKRLCCFVLAGMLAACSGQQATSSTGGSSSAQPQVSAVSNSSILSRDGCTVDLKQLGQAYIDQPTFYISSGGSGVEQYDKHRLEQNTRAHETFIWDVPEHPGSPNPIAAIQLTIAAGKTVSSASLLPDPPVTDKTIAFLKENGLCQEQHPDYAKLMPELTTKFFPSMQ